MNRVIISDTSCLIALEKIDALDILRKLYGEAIITDEVNSEYGKPLPSWVIVRKVKSTNKQLELEVKLDKGEASSIALALETENSLLIIDEHKGRKIAKSLDLNIIGTIGILIISHKKGILDNLTGTISKLVNSGFRISDRLIDRIFEKYENR